MSVGVEDTMVADGGAADVGAEVFDGGGSRTKGLDVDAPVGVPDGGVHLPIACLEAGTEVPPEGGLESGNRDEERVVFANKDIAISIKSGGGNNDVEMRVEVELLVPSVENGGEPARGSTEPLSLDQAILQSGGGRGEERVISNLGVRAEKDLAQFSWQGEGDHEIRCLDALGQFALDPFAGRFAPALRAGFVIAAVEGKGLLLARGAGIAVPAQGRGAAMGDGADRTPLRRSQDWSGAQIAGQEVAQDPDDTGSHEGPPVSAAGLESNAPPKRGCPDRCGG